MSPVIAVVVGVILLVTALWDAFSTIVLPRSVSFALRPSRMFGQFCWRLWRRVGRRARARTTRQSILSFFGPFSILLLLSLWAVMLLFAFAFLHWGLGTRLSESTGGFGTFLYMSGTTFFTLGPGDVVPVNRLGRALVVLEAGTGIVFLAMIIGYLPLLDQAYAQREVGVHLLESRAGSPQSAVLLVRRFGTLENATVLYTILLDLERWSAEVSQSHLAHVGLLYYRSQHLGQSWLITLTTILDACALVMVTSDRKGIVRQAEAAFRMALSVAVDMSRLLRVTAEQAARESHRLPPEELARLREVLRADGIALNPEAEMRLAQLRRLYEARVVALADWLMAPLPPWVPANVGPDSEPDFATLVDGA